MQKAQTAPALGTELTLATDGSTTGQAQGRQDPIQSPLGRPRERSHKTRKRGSRYRHALSSAGWSGVFYH